MQQSDRKRFASAMTALGEYYGREFTRPVLDIYWQGLAVYEIADVETGFVRHMRNPDNGQFMPKVADLVRLIEGSTQERASVAWTKLRRAIQNHGYYDSVVFDDPIIHAVVWDMGGWSLVSDLKTDQATFVERDFASRYRAYSARGVPHVYPARLIGAFEADNRSRGLLEYIKPAILIGDAEAAARVMALGSTKDALEERRVGDLIAIEAQAA